MNLRNTKKRMSGENTSKESLEYNEMEWNVKNFGFDPSQLFKLCQNFMNPHHPRHSCRNFDPCHFYLTRAKIFWTHIIHASHAKTSNYATFFDRRQKILKPTPPTPHMNPRTYSAHDTHAI